MSWKALFKIIVIINIITITIILLLLLLLLLSSILSLSLLLLLLLLRLWLLSLLLTRFFKYCSLLQGLWKHRHGGWATAVKACWRRGRAWGSEPFWRGSLQGRPARLAALSWLSLSTGKPLMRPMSIVAMTAVTGFNDRQNPHEAHVCCRNDCCHMLLQWQQAHLSQAASALLQLQLSPTLTQHANPSQGWCLLLQWMLSQTLTTGDFITQCQHTPVSWSYQCLLWMYKQHLFAYD